MDVGGNARTLNVRVYTRMWTYTRMVPDNRSRHVNITSRVYDAFMYVQHLVLCAPLLCQIIMCAHMYVTMMYVHICICKHDACGYVCKHDACACVSKHDACAHVCNHDACAYVYYYYACAHQSKQDACAHVCNHDTCAYVYTNVMHVHMYVIIMYVHMCLSMMHAHMYVTMMYVHVCICIHDACGYVCKHDACAYIYIYMRIYMHIYMHIYIYTRKLDACTHLSKHETWLMYVIIMHAHMCLNIIINTSKYCTPNWPLLLNRRTEHLRNVVSLKISTQRARSRILQIDLLTTYTHTVDNDGGVDHPWLSSRFYTIRVCYWHAHTWTHAYNSILEGLEHDPWPVKPEHRPLRCTGAALAVATGLLECSNANNPARIMLFLAGPCTEGPGAWLWTLTVVLCMCVCVILRMQSLNHDDFA
jgi:hypothetical protein